MHSIDQTVYGNTLSGIRGFVRMLVLLNGYSECADLDPSAFDIFLPVLVSLTCFKDVSELQGEWICLIDKCRYNETSCFNFLLPSLRYDEEYLDMGVTKNGSFFPLSAFVEFSF
ncbi:hypothetical protein STEG23_029553 [Scotinomys teguina]